MKNNNTKAFAAVVLGALGPIRLKFYTMGLYCAEDLPWEDMAAHLRALITGTSWNIDELIEHWDKLNEAVAKAEDEHLSFMHLTVCDVFDAMLEECNVPPKF
jgi:hypothetical protein